MPQITVDTELWNDPRFEQLREQVGSRYEAIGLLVYVDLVWGDMPTIPSDIFERIKHHSALVECGFAVKNEFGYCALGNE